MLADTLYKNVFEKEGEVENATEHLNNLVKKYPYFSLAHFYLLKKTSPTAQNYPETAARAALHFNNPFLLQQQLTDDGTYIDTAHTDAPATEEIKIAPAAIEQNEVVEQNEIAETSKEENFITPPAPVENEIDVQDAESEKSSSAIDVSSAPVTPIPEPETPEVNTDETATAPEKPVAEETLLFEPLHASDYFASQGIKLRDEPLPTDKLGKQLKSFTDWLKTMKKVHDTQAGGKELPVDVAIQQLAEKSNKEEAVITEAMAEVFLQQGKQHKAKEIYEKLSLLNPSKSAYFAAKLDLIQ